MNVDTRFIGLGFEISACVHTKNISSTLVGDCLSHPGICSCHEVFTVGFLAYCAGLSSSKKSADLTTSRQFSSESSKFAILPHDVLSCWNNDLPSSLVPQPDTDLALSCQLLQVSRMIVCYHVRSMELQPTQAPARADRPLPRPSLSVAYFYEC